MLKLTLMPVGATCIKKYISDQAYGAPVDCISSELYSEHIYCIRKGVPQVLKYFVLHTLSPL